jgi:hypothetical protein
MAITNTTLTTSAAALIDAPGEKAVTVIYLYNSSAGPVSINLHAVASGDTAGEANKFYGNLIVETTDTFIIDAEKILLSDGDDIFASANVDGVVHTTVSYATL